MTPAKGVNDVMTAHARPGDRRRRTRRLFRGGRDRRSDRGRLEHLDGDRTMAGLESRREVSVTRRVRGGRCNVSLESGTQHDQLHGRPTRCPTTHRVDGQDARNQGGPRLAPPEQERTDASAHRGVLRRFPASRPPAAAPEDAGQNPHRRRPPLEGRGRAVGSSPEKRSDCGARPVTTAGPATTGVETVDAVRASGRQYQLVLCAIGLFGGRSIDAGSRVARCVHSGL